MLAAVTRLFDGGGGAKDMTELGDQLALLKRWYYRPEKQRVGAIFFPVRGEWPVRKMVRAAGKLVAPVEAVAKTE